MINIIQLPVKNELAVEFGMARQTISKQMKESGIQTRFPETVQNRKRGLAYGKRLKTERL